MKFEDVTNQGVEEISQQLEIAGRELEELFATTAPKPPWWFSPKMPPRPGQPKRLSLDNGGELDRIIDAWHRDDCGNSLREWIEGKVDDEQYTDVLEYELELECWRDELERWELERERQRLAQWPWEYARLVMEARNGVS